MKPAHSRPTMQLEESRSSEPATTNSRRSRESVRESDSVLAPTKPSHPFERLSEFGVCAHPHGDLQLFINHRHGHLANNHRIARHSIYAQDKNDRWVARVDWRVYHWEHSSDVLADWSDNAEAFEAIYARKGSRTRFAQEVARIAGLPTDRINTDVVLLESVVVDTSYSGHRLGARLAALAIAATRGKRCVVVCKPYPQNTPMPGSVEKLQAYWREEGFEPIEHGYAVMLKNRLPRQTSKLNRGLALSADLW